MPHALLPPRPAAVDKRLDEWVGQERVASITKVASADGLHRVASGGGSGDLGPMAGDQKMTRRLKRQYTGAVCGCGEGLQWVGWRCLFRGALMGCWRGRAAQVRATADAAALPALCLRVLVCWTGGLGPALMATQQAHEPQLLLLPPAAEIHHVPAALEELPPIDQVRLEVWLGSSQLH